MGGELHIGCFADDSDRRVNRAANAIWFSRVGVQTAIEEGSIDGEALDIAEAIEAARLGEITALSGLTLAERQQAFEGYGRQCALSEYLGEQACNDGMTSVTNVVNVSFGQSSK